ncbi:MAG: hypothetical protein HY860_06290 [Chlamydiales bacterium]|nr:hypothetical protein [Chlamydiales bacterium]
MSEPSTRIPRFSGDSSELKEPFISAGEMNGKRVVALTKAQLTSKEKWVIAAVAIAFIAIGVLTGGIGFGVGALTLTVAIGIAAAGFGAGITAATLGYFIAKRAGPPNITSYTQRSDGNIEVDMSGYIRDMRQWMNGIKMEVDIPYEETLKKSKDEGNYLDRDGSLTQAGKDSVWSELLRLAPPLSIFIDETDIVTEENFTPASSSTDPEVKGQVERLRTRLHAALPENFQDLTDAVLVTAFPVHMSDIIVPLKQDIIRPHAQLSDELQIEVSLDEDHEKALPSHLDVIIEGNKLITVLSREQDLIVIDELSSPNDIKKVPIARCRISIITTFTKRDDGTVTKSCKGIIEGFPLVSIREKESPSSTESSPASE